jgi:mono/diheme cytochrome c family protein
MKTGEVVTFSSALAFFLFTFFLLFSYTSPASAATGKELYEQKCVSCHNHDGSGDTATGKAVGAKDLRSAEAKKMTDAQIATQIKDGKGNMPPFDLTKPEIDSVVAYVRELQKAAPPAKPKKPKK